MIVARMHFKDNKKISIDFAMLMINDYFWDKTDGETEEDWLFTTIFNNQEEFLEDFNECLVDAKYMNLHDDLSNIRSIFIDNPLTKKTLQAKIKLE